MISTIGISRSRGCNVLHNYDELKVTIIMKGVCGMVIKVDRV